MSGPVLLLILGGVITVAGIVVCFRYMDGAGVAGFTAIVVGIIVAIVAVGWGLSRENAECARRGGHMVPDGPPYYVKSGSVLIPVQPEKCEVAP